MFAKTVEVEVVQYNALLVLADEIPPDGYNIADCVVDVVAVAPLRTASVEYQ